MFSFAPTTHIHELTFLGNVCRERFRRRHKLAAYWCRACGKSITRRIA